jgi:hypothetical protein
VIKSSSPLKNSPSNGRNLKVGRAPRFTLTWLHATPNSISSPNSTDMMTYRYLKSILDVMSDTDLNQKVVIHDTYNNTFHPLDCFVGAAEKDEHGIKIEDYPVLQFSDVHIDNVFKKKDPLNSFKYTT